MSVLYQAPWLATGSPWGAAPAAVPSYASAVLVDTPSIYLRMNETSGTKLADSSGNDRPGTVVAPTWRSGDLITDPTGDSVRFNVPDSSRAYVPVVSEDYATTGYTVEGWFNTLDMTSTFFSMDDDATNKMWQLHSGSFGIPSLIYYISGGGSGSVVTTNGSRLLVDGKVHHLVITFSAFPAGTWTIYLDGEVSSQGTYASSNSTLPTLLQIGSSRAAPSMLGQVSEVAFYRTALSPTQVAAHHAAGRWTAPPTNLKATWTGSQTVLDWDDSPSVVTGYEIQRSVDGTSKNLQPGAAQWFNNGSSTVSVDPTEARTANDGPASKVVTTATAGAGATGNGMYLATPGTTARMTAYVKGTPGVVIRPQARRNVASTGLQGSPTVNGTDVTLTGGWDRLGVTDTLLAGENGFSMNVFVVAAEATTFWVDDGQIELGPTPSAYQSPWWNYTSTDSTYTDTSSGLAYSDTFTYRVRTVGVGGPSAWATVSLTKQAPFAAFGIPL